MAKERFEQGDTTSVTKVEVNNQNIWGMGIVFVQRIRRAISGPEPLHPDFRIIWKYDANLTWYQNKSWGGMPQPKYKIGFFIDDLSALDECPWVCKFGKNLNPDIKSQYFCVAYGDPQLWKKEFGLQEMTQWAMQFDHPNLLTYQGQLVKELKPEQPHLYQLKLPEEIE